MFDVKAHLSDLKGKDYLEVKWRLVWFREDHPNWGIDTSLISHDKETNTAVFQAVIYDDREVQVSSGHGSECIKDFRDYIEKAETKAVGRALAMLGYGTQFAPEELDEGERIVDAPVARKPTQAAPATPLDYVFKSGRYANMNVASVLKADGGREYLERLLTTSGITDGLKKLISEALGTTR